MIAEVPSRIAFATSDASARVGSGEWIIDSSICVAVITGLPRSSAREDDPLLQQRHVGGADLDAEVAARDHDRVGLARGCRRARRSPRPSRSSRSRGRSSRAPRSASCSACTSAAERTNESATKSTPSSSANSRSSMILARDRRDRQRHAGQVDALVRRRRCRRRATSQRARPRSTSSTRSRTAPSSIRTSLPGCSTEPSTAGLTGRSPSCAPRPRRRSTTSSPRSSVTGSAQLADAELRPLQVGDQRDRPSPQLGLPPRARAGATRAWSSCVPCEKFRRAPSMPACDQRREHLRRRRGGPDRGDDLRAARRARPSLTPSAVAPGTRPSPG